MFHNAPASFQIEPVKLAPLLFKTTLPACQFTVPQLVSAAFTLTGPAMFNTPLVAMLPARMSPALSVRLPAKLFNNTLALMICTGPGPWKLGVVLMVSGGREAAP